MHEYLYRSIKKYDKNRMGCILGRAIDFYIFLSFFKYPSFHNKSLFPWFYLWFFYLLYFFQKKSRLYKKSFMQRNDWRSFYLSIY